VSMRFHYRAPEHPPFSRFRAHQWLKSCALDTLCIVVRNVQRVVRS
jgi:hypothetical protein